MNGSERTVGSGPSAQHWTADLGPGGHVVESVVAY
jgi:hypothetical protein